MVPWCFLHGDLKDASLANLHARFACDEIFVVGVHDAVDHIAVILTTVLSCLGQVEGQLAVSEAKLTQLGQDATTNDDTLDAQLHAELN